MVGQERTALALSPSGYITLLQMSLASKYSLPAVANCGATCDHMMPCGVEIKHASMCQVHVLFIVWIALLVNPWK